MTLGIVLETGEGTIHLSAKEWSAFKEGEVVKKFSGDAKGDFEVTLKLTRKRKKK